MFGVKDVCVCLCVCYVCVEGGGGRRVDGGCGGVRERWGLSFKGLKAFIPSRSINCATICILL